jgi:tyrosyl-tRNA synthetase
MAIEASEFLFGKGTNESLRNLNEQDFLSIFEGVPKTNISLDIINNGINIVELLADKTGIFSSKSEARRMLSSGAVSINKTKVTEYYRIDIKDILNNKYLLIQKGKKNYHLLITQF